MKITSIHNQKILALRQLYKNNERKNSDVFLAEGQKEVLRGINSGFDIIAIYYSSEILDEKDFTPIFSTLKKEIEIFDIDKNDAVCYDSKASNELVWLNGRAAHC